MNDIASKMTLDRIRAVCPDARGDIVETIITDAATQFVAPGPDTLLAAVHFLAQCAAETGGLKRLDENMNYSALRLTQVFPGKFPNIASTAGYVGDPEKIANYVYGNRLGNGPPAPATAGAIAAAG